MHGYFIANKNIVVNINYISNNTFMNTNEKSEILKKAQEWFLSSLVDNHIKNTEKLSNPSEFNINPFLVSYLASYLTGNCSPESIAKALIYPRVLGQSITTSFGTNMQKFSTEVLSSFGSAIPGIDIEFVDQVDKQKKYCQLKAGPNTINKDDVKTIHEHFGGIIRLAKTNNLRIANDDLIICVIYGGKNELSGHYKCLENDYHHPIFVGQSFWYRLTGDEFFYQDLIATIVAVSEQADGKEIIKRTVRKLASSDVVIAISNSVKR